jgi:hypothetical protein
LTMPRGEVLLKPFGRLDPSDAGALDEDAAEVVRCLAGGVG